jgi:hypothetical protein
MYMILPDREVDLGIVAEDELIITGERPTPLGVKLEAFKIHKDDPRAQKHSRLRAVAGGVLGGIGIGLMAAIPAPRDQADAGRGGIAERQR